MITFFIKLFNAMNNPTDYVEADEWKVQDWQDLHQVLRAWK